MAEVCKGIEPTIGAMQIDDRMMRELSNMLLK